MSLRHTKWRRRDLNRKNSLLISNLDQNGRKTIISVTPTYGIHLCTRTADAVMGLTLRRSWYKNTNVVIYIYIFVLFLISFQKIFWFSFKFFLTIFCFSSSCRGSNSSISVPFQLKNNRELNKLCIYQGVVVKFTMWVGVWELIQFRGQLTQAN